MTDNHQILSDFSRGNLKALYGSMYRPLIMYASKCLSDRFSFLAEDCVQDAIFKAYQSRRVFPSLSALRSYLYTAVRNKSIDILRKSQAQENYLTGVSSISDDLFTDILEQETKRRLFEAVDQLPDREKEMFFLFMDGNKISEVAQIIGLAESTVKQKKARIIARLRQLISDGTVLALALSILSDPFVS